MIGDGMSAWTKLKANKLTIKILRRMENEEIFLYPGPENDSRVDNR